MTVKEFAAITRQVIDQGSFDDFVPTACYPARQELRVLQDLPTDVEPEPAVLKWAMDSAPPGEEFLVAFKTGPSEFSVIRQNGKKRESAKFQVR